MTGISDNCYRLWNGTSSQRKVSDGLRQAIKSNGQVCEENSNHHLDDNVKCSTNQVVNGGDIYHALTDREVDSLAAAIGIPLALPSRTFFDLEKAASGEHDVSEFERQLHRIKLQLKPGAVWVTWVRHHWVTAQATTTDEWTVLDSAQSTMVQRSLCKIAKWLNWKAPRFLLTAQQVRGSQDCGIFALMHAFMLVRGCWSRDIRITPTTQRCALTQFRTGLLTDPLQAITGAIKMVYGINMAETEHFVQKRWTHNPYGLITQARHTHTKEDKLSKFAQSNYHQQDRIKQSLGSTAATQVQLVKATPVLSESIIGRGKDLIDIEEEEQKELMITEFKLTQLPAEWQHTLRPFFEIATLEEQQAFQDGVSRTRQEYEKLSNKERIARKDEFQTRLKTKSISPESTSLTLRRIPLEFRTKLQPIVMSIREEQLELRRKQDIADTFDNASTYGHFISSFLIDRALRDARNIDPNWTIIGSNDFDRYVTQSILPRINEKSQHVAAVAFKDSHYVLLTAKNIRHQDKPAPIEIRDSLNWGIRTFKGQIDAFRTLLRSMNAFVQDGVKVVTVPRQPQGSNDCALEVTNNLCEVLTNARGHLSRNLIGQIGGLSDPFGSDEACTLWQSIWRNDTGTNKEHGGQSMTTQEPMKTVMATEVPRTMEKTRCANAERIHIEHKQTSASYSNEVANEGSQCCKREKLFSGCTWCAWHHPRAFWVRAHINL